MQEDAKNNWNWTRGGLSFEDEYGGREDLLGYSRIFVSGRMPKHDR